MFFLGQNGRPRSINFHHIFPNHLVLRDAGDLKIGNVVYDTKVKTCKFDQNIAIKKLSKRAEQHGVEESGQSDDEEDCDSANGSIARSNRHFTFVEKQKIEQ